MIAQSLSIALILRRNPPRLAAAINLLLAAAARISDDYELILVTCSDDRQLVETTDRLVARHESVLVLHHSAARSYAYAMRDAWSVARSELLFAIDDDGVAAARALPQLHAAMQNHAVALAYRTARPAVCAPIFQLAPPGARSVCRSTIRPYASACSRAS
ncbi:MAG: glycosyltransferase [Oscillochloris sp.]|nr:glycosyltransferase [Oscillochloris sp.]